MYILILKSLKDRTVYKVQVHFCVPLFKILPYRTPGKMNQVIGKIPHQCSLL